MPLTVAALAADEKIGLMTRVHGSQQAMQREIYWSHPTELINPQLFSQENEIVITSGAMIPRKTRSNMHRVDEAAELFIDNLAQAHVCALAFGTRLLHKTIPRQVLDHARRRDLPVLEIPIEVPFSLVAHAVTRAVESDKQMRLRQAYAKLHTMMQAASSRNAPRALVLNLATSIGGWCVLCTPYGTVMESSHLSAIATANAALAKAASRSVPGVMHVGRECVSVMPLTSPNQGGLGTLVVGSRSEFDEYDDSLIVFASSLLGVTLFRREHEDDMLHRLRGVMMRDACNGQTRLLGEMALPLWQCELPKEPVSVVNIQATAEQRSLIAAQILAVHDTRPNEHGWLFGEFDDALWMICSTSGYKQIVDTIVRNYTVSVGISQASPWCNVKTATMQALVAASEAPDSTPAVHHFGEHPGSELLHHVLEGVNLGACRGVVAALQDADPRLCDTLTAWLSNQCNGERAAHMLGIHRHTLTKRLECAERCLSGSLADPQVRTELWLALSSLNTGAQEHVPG